MGYADIIQVLGVFFGHVYKAFRICVSIGIFYHILASCLFIGSSVFCLANSLQGWGRDACEKKKPTFLTAVKLDRYSQT